MTAFYDKDTNAVIVHAGIGGNWKNHKYIKKIGDRYFYTMEELRKFGQRAGNVTDKYITGKSASMDMDKASRKINDAQEAKRHNARVTASVDESAKRRRYGELRENRYNSEKSEKATKLADEYTKKYRSSPDYKEALKYNREYKSLNDEIKKAKARGASAQEINELQGLASDAKRKSTEAYKRVTNSEDYKNSEKYQKIAVEAQNTVRRNTDAIDQKYDKERKANREAGEWWDNEHNKDIKEGTKDYLDAKSSYDKSLAGRLDHIGAVMNEKMSDVADVLAPVLNSAKSTVFSIMGTIGGLMPDFSSSAKSTIDEGAKIVDYLLGKRSSL